MKYDLLIVGGGPGGLMAARRAAEAGLKTLLLEKKPTVTKIHRACSQIFYTRKLSPSGDSETGKPRSDGYIEPVSVEVGSEATQFHFEKPGFSVEYHGCLRPYLNWLHVSPGGHTVNRYPVNYRPWGFHFSKETLVTELAEAAANAGAEIRGGTTGLGAENTPQGGVKVRLKTGDKEEIVEARAVIAADGIRSRIADSVGLTAKRDVIGPTRAGNFVQYIMEGIETGYPLSSWLTWTVPSLNPTGFIAIGLAEEDRLKIGTLTAGDLSPVKVLDDFIKHPNFAHMFRHARIVKKEAMGRQGAMLGPIREPVAGNVVIIGDAGAIAETWVQGALACAHQAVKAIVKELGGESGYPDYTAWWQQAFAFNTPDYIKMVATLYPLPRIATDDEIDYVYSIFKDRTGIPQVMLAHALDQVRAERPALFEKLEQVRQRMEAANS